MKKLLTLLFIGTISISSFAQKSKQDMQMEQFVGNLLNKMTLEEKIGQMNQVNLEKIDDTLLRRIKNGQIGSMINITDPKEINQVQEIAVKESRLGIPLIIGRDVIHGFKTIFPIPLGQAATFDPQSVEAGARIAATEARETGIHWTFAPMLDISRDARWGRIAESLGEDPYLAGELGVAMIKGFQGNDLSANNALAACAKHFVGYGAAEGGRDYNSTNIPPRLMRNVYLPPFKKAIEAGSATIMTSFNENDGVPSSGNSFLLKDILRKEWDFKGFVVSDWNSMGEMIRHGYSTDRKEVAMQSANAGIDMEMVSETYTEHLKELVAEKKVSIEDINDYVHNILCIKYRLGLFDHPYVKTPKKSTAYNEEHLRQAKDVAIKSAILLKNDNILPLKTTQKIAVFGPMADAKHDQLGTWVFDGDKNHTVTPLMALQQDYKNVSYTYEPILAYSRDKNKAGFKKAKQIASKADVCVVFLGEESILSGEAHSLSSINLIGIQSELLQTIKSAGKPVVMVIMAGRPLTIERDLPYADAVLYNFHPGTMGGPAIWDLLFGKANPSGKLPVTFVREVGQIPMFYNHNSTGRPAEWVVTLDQIPQEAPQTSLGNTSFYLDSGDKPLFPFGYGLSYSKYEYSDLTLSAKDIKMNDTLSVKTTIKNTGDVEGEEIVQLYIQDLVGSSVRPVKELKRFTRIYLDPNEAKTVEFKLTVQDLAFYGKDLVNKAEPGDFKLWVGPSSAEGLESKFTLQ